MSARPTAPKGVTTPGFSSRPAPLSQDALRVIGVTALAWHIRLPVARRATAAARCAPSPRRRRADARAPLNGVPLLALSW